MKRRNPGRSFFREAIILLTASLLTLLVLELLARVALHREFGAGLLLGGPLLELTPHGLRLRPHQRLDWLSPLSGRTIRLETNAHGFRGPELARDGKRVGRPRILVLGDSIAFGPGVDDRDTWPRQLERFFGNQVEVVNAGIPDVGTQEELELLRREGPRLRPDLVLLGYYLNDSLPPYSYGLEYGTMSPAQSAWITRMRKTSYLFRWVWERYLVARYVQTSGRGIGPWVRLFEAGEWRSDPLVFGELIQKAESDFGAAWTEAGWREVPSQLRQMQEWTRANQARLVVAVFPVSIQAEAEFQEDSPQSRLGRICSELGIPYLDLLPVMRARSGQKLFFDQCHLTPAGAALAGETIGRFLLGQGLIP